jgi:hypothetical protein
MAAKDDDDERAPCLAVETIVLTAPTVTEEEFLQIRAAAAEVERLRRRLGHSLRDLQVKLAPIESALSRARSVHGSGGDELPRPPLRVVDDDELPPKKT